MINSASDHSSDSSQSVPFGTSAVYMNVDGSTIAEIFPLKYTESRSCKFTSSPAESGMEMIDSKFRLPTVISFSGLIMADQYSKLSSLKDAIANNQKKFVTFYGKDGEVDGNMLVERFEKTGDADHLDALLISVTLREYIQSGS